MRRRAGPLRVAAAIAALLAAGCGSSGVLERPATAPSPVRELPPPPAPAPAQTPQADPIGDVIAQSQRLFERGQQELELGHLAQAKLLFDRALDSLLELPEGARSNARLKEHFDRLVEQQLRLREVAQTHLLLAALEQALRLSDRLVNGVGLRCRGRRGRRRGGNQVADRYRSRGGGFDHARGAAAGGQQGRDGRGGADEASPSTHQRPELSTHASGRSILTPAAATIAAGSSSSGHCHFAQAGL